MNNIMQNKKRLEINIFIKNITKIYNQYNENQLSDELSNYIYNQCKGKHAIKNINLNINHDFDINNEEKIKLINTIRENYGIDIKENLLKMKHERIKEIILFFIGVLLIIFSKLFNYINGEIMGEIISIFGWVAVWEIAYNLIFAKTKIIIENKRLKKLTEAKIIFNKIEKKY